MLFMHVFQKKHTASLFLGCTPKSLPLIQEKKYYVPRETWRGISSHAKFQKYKWKWDNLLFKVKPSVLYYYKNSFHAHTSEIQLDSIKVLRKFLKEILPTNHGWR